MALIMLSMILTHLIISHSLNKEIDDIPSVLNFEADCQTVSGQHVDTLTLVAYSEHMTRKVMEVLCSNSEIAKQFGKVRAFWQPDEKQMFEFVGQGTADLILIKDNFVRAFNSDITYGYQQIASYNDYAAYMIGNKEKPILSKEYLLGKRIGVLDYPSSRSGHIAPMRLLKRLGLDSNQVALNYAKSHAQLRIMLSKGEVDMISSFWSEKDEQYFHASYRTPLAEQISGSKWYLKSATQNVELRCAVQTVLMAIKEDYEGYYSNLMLEQPCVYEESS
ncbi:MAG: PhnD/SsuA/transferrin family substrate-binding protein [Aestuariibacter sp.]